MPSSRPRLQTWSGALRDALRRGRAAWTGRGARLGRFGRDKGGQVAIIFAVSALTLVTGIGAGVDLSRTFVARQQLFHAATLTCQYSVRPTVVAVAYQNGSSTATYIANVNTASRAFVTAQSPSLVQTNATPFAHAMGGASSVSMAANVPTFFMGIVGVNSLPVGTKVSCANGQVQPDEKAPSLLVKESFEYSACTGTCWSAFPPTGKPGQYLSTPVNTPPNNYGYTGQSGNQWTVTGYCVEIDAVGVIKSTVADGTYSAELDCDNGSGSKGNSSISTENYMTPGTYELRYNYSGRIGYKDYSPTVICGSSATDLAWANDTTSDRGTALRTNQINVYLDQDSTGTAPTHTTLDGTQQLAGVNLIDECVYSDNWVERSVKITVTTAGYYWLSFAADGANDSYGGQLDNIRLCRGTCTGSVADNFPPAWKTSPLLFEDTFDAPTYTDPGNGINTNGVLASSTGTSGQSGSGWPLQPASGWAVAPYNQVDYLLKNSQQGAQSLELDGLLASGQTTSNRYMSRYFYLVPGYYRVDYQYASDELFTNQSITYCMVPTGPFPYYAHTTSYNSTNRITGASGTYWDVTNSLAVFMSNSQLSSYPNVSSTLNAVTTYTNPDGSVTSAPTAAPDALNINTYNPAQNNPLIDYCAFTNVWTPRTTYVKITKPAMYWLTFSAQGSADNTGPAIDDVKLTAQASPYGTAPGGAVTIPTAGPAPNSTISYPGFNIKADVFAP